MKPIIGITCNYDTMDTVGTCSGMGSSGQDWNFLAGEYVYAVEKSGGIPVILPRLQDMSALEPFLSQIDGLLVTGGHDVDPTLTVMEKRFRENAGESFRSGMKWIWLWFGTPINIKRQFLRSAAERRSWRRLWEESFIRIWKPRKV